MKLQFSGIQEIKKRYRQASQLDELELHFEEGQRQEAIKASLDAGWVGLFVEAPIGDFASLKAFKGKHGPCRNGHQKTLYDGKFLGVWDDDHHLILSGSPLPVCIKTGRVHGQQPYHPYLKVEPSQASKDFGSFDCDDLQKNLDKLGELLSTVDSISEKSVSVYYGGPFSKVITKGGHLLHRGQIGSLPKTAAHDLQDEGVKVFEQKTLPLLTLDSESVPPSHPLPSPNPKAPSWAALKTISKGLRQKILIALEKKRNVMILTGSDPQEEQGCCPSEDVGSANALVRAGILNVVEENRDDEGCSITFYAFAGNVSNANENEVFLAKISSHLFPKWKTPLKVLLLACVVISIISGVTKLVQQRLQEPAQLEKLLQTGQSHHLILFQEIPRCPPCLAMEKLVKVYSSENKIPFTSLNLNNGRYLQIVEDHGLFSATLFILSRHQGKVKIQLHHPAAELWQDPEKFHQSLEKVMGLE